MSNDPYAAPEASLETEGEVVPSSIWKAKGRLSWLSYWAHTLVVTIVFVVLTGILGTILGTVGGGLEALIEGREPNTASLIIGLLVGLPAIIAALWISVCMMIKRLHDRNHTGWLGLLFFVPFVNVIFGLYALLFPGNKTSNNFGAPRPTKNWEKVLGIIMLTLYGLLIAVSIAAPFLGMASGV